MLDRGIDYIRLNIEDLLNIEVVGSVNENSNSPYMKIKSNGMEVDIANIRVGWIRHFDFSIFDFGSNELISSFIFQQWYTAFDSLQNMLSCKWVNSPGSLRESFNKLKQLQLAKEHGFMIPNTIITNSPSRAVEFVRSNFNDVIVKPLLHHRIESKSKLYSLYTHSITSNDIPKLGDLSYAPCILQERIHKGSELRVTIVENKVFVSEIFPSQVSQDFVDMHAFRIQNLITKPIAINNDFEKRCVALIKSMNLKFGAIDFVKDLGNNIYFLEVNALGDWLWIEQEYRLPITESVVNLIADMTK